MTHDLLMMYALRRPTRTSCQQFVLHSTSTILIDHPTTKRQASTTRRTDIKCDSSVKSYFQSRQNGEFV